jgi:hypothetical protein
VSGTERTLMSLILLFIIIGGVFIVVKGMGLI